MHTTFLRSGLIGLALAAFLSSGPAVAEVITYKAALAEIDARMAAHVVFLKKYYASGNFLVSGRKIPRDGGIILAEIFASAIQFEGRLAQLAIAIDVTERRKAENAIRESESRLRAIISSSACRSASSLVFSASARRCWLTS